MDRMVRSSNRSSRHHSWFRRVPIFFSFLFWITIIIICGSTSTITTTTTVVAFVPERSTTTTTTTATLLCHENKSSYSPFRESSWHSNQHCRRRRLPRFPSSATSSSSLHAQEKENDSIMEVERPDPSILLSAKADASQRFGFVVICLSLALGTYLTVELLGVLEHVLPDHWFDLWREYTWPYPLGLVFIAAGVAHFLQKEAFVAMVPPKGTWGGLWQVPAPGMDVLGVNYEEYHTYWTGVAEIGGGVLLIIGALNNAPELPALLLFLLTAAVTPANIYMATHDIQPPGLPPVPYPLGHFYRGVLQCVLLALFYKLAFP